MSSKRLFDIFFSLLGMIITLPIFLIIPFVILLEDGRPIFFKHTRVGKDGVLFRLIKFRTMENAISADSFEPGNRFRITRSGSVLRKYKLDELPQLINVLKGEMSIVGPRPEVPEWVQTFSDRYEKILTVKPGITDNASIEYRDEEIILSESVDPYAIYREVILPRKMFLYEEYVETHSLKGDIQIIINTILAL